MSEQEYLELFSKKIKQLLEDNNLNQQELAAKLGLSESTVGKWVLMKSIPRMGVIQKMSDLFHVPKSYFFEEATPPQEYDPDAEEILALLERPDMHDLKMLFMKTGNLSQEDKEQIVRILKATLPQNGRE